MGSERRKHKRKRLPTPVDTRSSSAHLCPHVQGLLPDEQHWKPPVIPSPHAAGRAFPSALVVPSQTPYLLPSFPFQDMASQGVGDSAAWGAAAGCPPLSPDPHVSAFPSAYLDTLMTVFLHNTPLFPLWPASFSPYPFLADTGSSELAPFVPAAAPNLEPTSSDQGQRRVEENWEAHGEELLFISSRSSSPLQLNLLQEEMPAPSKAVEAVRRGAGPDAKHVSAALCTRGPEKAGVLLPSQGSALPA